MDKYDVKVALKPLYQPKAGDFTQVTVPPLPFLMVDGQGAPESDTYANAVQWLYSVAYPMKFMAKAQTGKDFAVSPLEALWWADDYAAFTRGERGDWRWRAMLALPDWIDREMYDAAVAKAQKKLGIPPDTLRMETFEEGLCVQIMHLGPYSAEAPTIKRLHEDYLPANGLKENGEHHEIYLNDPRRVAPEKLKTILRQPVRPA